MKQNKIGTFFGVIVPNITMMLGVILFLRLGILVGHAGLFTMTSVIFLSLGFMTITSLSIASMATNIRMGGGGVYYLITRSLGIEIGGAVGFALYFSQLISIALTTTGFAYTICEMFPNLSIVAVEIGTILTLSLLSSASSKGALRLQFIILLILFSGVLSVYAGSINNVTPLENTTPLFQNGTISFWETFAFFFPAMTGIEAGMAMSGILRTPGRSLFIGNITGLLVVAFIYLSLSIFAYYQIPDAYLSADPFIFVQFSWSPLLVNLGILTATLSSALGSFLGAPRMLESMAKDGLAPSYFGRTYGVFQEPRWALAFTSVTVAAIALSTNIDQIIPILTMICLITYGLLNFVAGLAELMNTVSWRPIVRTPWWLSLSGSLLAVTMMLFINVTWTFISLGLFLLLYIFFQGRNITAGFQDIRQSLVFFFSRSALYHLGSPAEHALVWHPQLLVAATSLTYHNKMAHLAHSLTKRSGILTFAAFVPDSWQDPVQLESSKATLDSHLEKENISALVEVQPAANSNSGINNMIRTYGIGPIQPNTIMIPIEEAIEDFTGLMETIETCRLMRKNLILFKDSDNVSEDYFTTPGQEEKRLDLWWNGDDRNSFDLSISLMTTLHDGNVWGDSSVKLNSVVSSKSARGVMQKFFKDFIKQSRLPFTPHIHLEPNSSDYLPFVEKYSSNAQLLCVCLRAFNDDESQENYQLYLEEVINCVQNLGACLLVTSYDEVERREIYQYTN
ncbi:MAG: hypothetical protein VX777_00595 [Chlamydiota bacterium]|nr:hypothetical protein [Chlamydiota bacterium]